VQISRTGIWGSHVSGESRLFCKAPPTSGLSLIFRAGQRPSTDDVLRLTKSRGSAAREPWAPGFAAGHQPEPGAGWLELLATGLAFDLVGLSPAKPAPLPEMVHFYGLPGTPTDTATEAITLIPGERLQAGDNLLSVIRIMAGLAAQLAELANVLAVVWQPARCAMAPNLFAPAIASWLSGGVFPALGLTALFRDTDGAIRSEGLALFIGKELRIEPSLGKTTAQDAKIATRLINHLVGSEAIHQTFDFLGPNDEQLTVEPQGSDELLRVWRKS
jgi:hypothetical protein